MRSNKQIQFVPTGHTGPVTGTIIDEYKKGPGRGYVIVCWQGTTMWGEQSPHMLRECLPVINGVIAKGL